MAACSLPVPAPTIPAVPENNPMPVPTIKPPSIDTTPLKSRPKATDEPTSSPTQTLSFDAYLKFIEDVFLGGARLDPKTDGRPDPRPDMRESANQLGDLVNDFDFTQTPLKPLLLSQNPKPGPASIPGTSKSFIFYNYSTGGIKGWFLVILQGWKRSSLKGQRNDFIIGTI